MFCLQVKIIIISKIKKALVYCMKKDNTNASFRCKQLIDQGSKSRYQTMYKQKTNAVHYQYHSSTPKKFKVEFRLVLVFRSARLCAYCLVFRNLLLSMVRRYWAEKEIGFWRLNTVGVLGHLSGISPISFPTQAFGLDIRRAITSICFF